MREIEELSDLDEDLEPERVRDSVFGGLVSEFVFERVREKVASPVIVGVLMTLTERVCVAVTADVVDVVLVAVALFAPVVDLVAMDGECVWETVSLHDAVVLRECEGEEERERIDRVLDFVRPEIELVAEGTVEFVT